jgi:H+/Cl- antiporter ClcA
VNASPPQAPDGAPQLRDTLFSARYLRLLAVSALLGVPISLVCFFFVGLQHALQHWVWESLPRAIGQPGPPWWWPLPALLLGGLLLVPVVTRMPGGGGHVPVHGLGGPPLGPSAVPGVVLAALTVLTLGAALGPEAPLMALGSGLALLALLPGGRAAGPQARAVLGATGSTAAIATILGGPLVAVLLVVEAAGLGGPRLVVLLLPCLLAGATGALVFTGFGEWTGLKIGALTLPEVPPDATPDAADFLWGVPLAVLIAVLLTAGRRLGRLTARWTARRPAVRTVVCAVAVGGCMSAYALMTGRSSQEAALSGQATLAQLAAHPGTWSVAALLALVLCKGLAWAISLGSLRGGPIFPSVLIGAAAGVACSGLPGFGVTAGLAVGLATATAAVTGLPLTAAVLAILLLGTDGQHQTPLAVVCSVVGYGTAQFLRNGEIGESGENGGNGAWRHWRLRKGRPSQ